MEKLKKCLLLIGGVFTIIFERVLTVKASRAQILYGPPVAQPLYGTVAPTTSETMVNILTTILLPLGLLIILFFGIRKLLRRRKKG